MRTLALFLLLSVMLPEGFDPAKWPGKMTRDPAMNAILAELRVAQSKRDAKAMSALVADFRAKMGPYVAVPENKPSYGSPIDASQPDVAKIEAATWQFFQSFAADGHHTWDRAMRAKKQGEAPPRLRSSTREVTLAFREVEAGSPHAAEYRAAALAGADYIASEQTSVGAFGYPYDPKAAPGSVSGNAAAMVKEGEAHGKKMVENGWLIDDGDEGGLQFDNGEAGAAMLQAYAHTGKREYLDAAKRAGDWAIPRMLVLNWNYNSYSGWLLARLYRVTRDRRYLDAAIDKFEFGVLPGQLEFGRWVDQHNASPQYHALMIRGLVEYCLALKQAGDAHAASARKHTELALDSMAEETIRYGASNVQEGLPLEALSLGLMALGPNAQWEKAAAIYANFEADHAETGRLNLPAYLLYRKKAKSCEISPEACTK